MSCCMSGSRTDNDNGNDSNDGSTTDGAGTVIGQDPTEGGKVPAYYSPGGNTGPNQYYKGVYMDGGSVHSLGKNGTVAPMSADEVKKLKSGKIDATSSQNESGGNPAAYYMDKNGTWSLGTYQINTGNTMPGFLNYTKTTNPDLYNQLTSVCNGTVDSTCVTSDAFKDNWISVAKSSSVGDLQTAEFGFVASANYTPLVQSVKNSTGLDLSSQPIAVQQMAYSTAIQYGPNLGAKVISQALSGQDTSTMSTDSIINAISDKKISSVNSYFTKRTSENPSLVARWQRERITALNGGA